MLDVTPENKAYLTTVLISADLIPMEYDLHIYRLYQIKLKSIRHKDFYLMYHLGMSSIVYTLHIAQDKIQTLLLLNQVQTETWCALVILNTDLNTLAEALRALADPLTY